MDTHDVYRRSKVFIGQMASMTWLDVDQHYSSVITGKVGCWWTAFNDRPLRPRILRGIGHNQSFPDQFHDVAEGQLFAPSCFDLSVDRHFARLDADLCFATGSHQPASLDEIVQSNYRFSLMVHEFLAGAVDGRLRF